MKRNCSFTIIELLTVIVIILTIMGIGVPAYNSWRNRGKIAKARATIAKLEMALEMYKTDFGEYPGSLGRLKAAESSGKGPYIDSKEYRSGNFYDPWNSIYDYEKTDETVSITSYGPDCSPGTKDDISNVGAW